MFGTSVGRAQSSLYGAMKSPLRRIALSCCHGVHETNTGSFMITEIPHMSLSFSRPPYEGSKTSWNDTISSGLSDVLHNK